MTAFWIAGIGINLAALAALGWWALRNWRQGDERDDPRDRSDRH